MTDATLDSAADFRPAQVKARRRLKRPSAIFGLGLALALGGVWYGHDWWTSGQFIESTDDAYVGGDATPIAPHIAGFVAAIPVADNQFVHAGDIIVRLDERDMRAALDHAAAVLREREAALTGLRSKYAAQQLTILQAAADLDAKQAAAAFAGQDAARYRSLALTAAGSQQNAQRTRAADAEARSAAAASQAGLEVAKEQIKELDAAIAEAGAAVAQAQADLQTARLNVGYAVIRAPIDGFVGNRAAEIGAYVAAGAYLLTIVPAHGLWIDANFKEDQVARMAPGQPATITADAAPGQVLHGRVVSLAPATGAVFSVIPPENATGNFTKIVQRVPVRIALDGRAATLGEIQPGLSIVASVDTRAPAGGAR